MFWLDHLRHNRHVNAILILDNCAAHQIHMSLLPPKLTIKFLPPNVTSRYQPADMGMISSLKIGYKMLLLKRLLEMFDADGGYELVAEQRTKQKGGKKGWHVVGSHIF